MIMSDQNVADLYSFQKFFKGMNMGCYGWPRIYDRYFISAHDIGACTVEGEGRGVMGHESPDKRGDLCNLTIFRRKIFIEFNHIILICFYFLNIFDIKF